MTYCIARVAIFAALMLGVSVAADAPVSAQTAASKAEARSWYGTYVHSETIPRPGGVTAAIDYRLTLSDAGCRLDAKGLQTDTDIVCTARMNGNDLQIGFRSYADGVTTNQYGVARYAPGAPLLMLTRTLGGLVTTWQGFTTSDGERRSGRYFVKMR